MVTLFHLAGELERKVGRDAIGANGSTLVPCCLVLTHPKANRQPRLVRLLNHLLGRSDARRDAAATKLLRLGNMRFLKRTADDKPNWRVGIDLAP